MEFPTATLATLMITAECEHVECDVLAADFGLLLGMLALALSRHGFWPINVTALKQSGLLVHIGSLTSACSGMAKAYAVCIICWT